MDGCSEVKIVCLFVCLVRMKLRKIEDDEDDDDDENDENDCNRMFLPATFLYNFKVLL